MLILVFTLFLIADSSVRNVMSNTVEVTYAVATKTNPKLENFETPIDTTKINNQNSVIFIIHGWTNTGDRPWIQNLTNALLKRNSKYSIVSVDWRKPANESYPIAVKNVKQVGHTIGDTIANLTQKNDVPLKNIHVIGHSLGAHVAAFAGQRVKAKLSVSLPWITGLDPAGPLYEVPVKVPKSQRLSSDDADVVEVVHTDGGLLGFHSSIGTIDFFPNGGLFIQPNCSSSSVKNIEELENAAFCSHEKSCQYYTKAIEEQGLEATKCISWYSYKSGFCKNNEKETFGSLTAPKRKGKFYFRITGPVLNVV